MKRKYLIVKHYNIFFLLLLSCEITFRPALLPKRARQKKLAFLDGHSPKALTPPPYQLAEQKRFYASFFFTYRHLNVFERANSVMENCLNKNSKMSPENKSRTAETGRDTFR